MLIPGYNTRMKNEIELNLARLDGTFENFRDYIMLMCPSEYPYTVELLREFWEDGYTVDEVFEWAEWATEKAQF